VVLRPLFVVLLGMLVVVGAACGSADDGDDDGGALASFTKSIGRFGVSAPRSPPRRRTDVSGPAWRIRGSMMP
jgi:hypothetical protein